MHVIKAKHNLMNYIGSLKLGKSIDFSEPFKKFSTFYQFWNNIIVLIILDKINYPNNIWMRFLS